MVDNTYLVASGVLLFRVIVLATILGALTWSLGRDRRRLRCGVLATASLVVLLDTAVVVARWLGLPTGPVTTLFLPQPGTVWLLSWILPVTLMSVTSVVGMQGGRRPVNLAAIVLGWVGTATLVASTFLWQGDGVVLPAVATLIIALAAAGSVTFITWVAQGLLQDSGQWGEDDLGPEVVLVLGARLVRGQMTRLLAARVDAGLRAWERADRERPGTPLLVLSGGTVGSPVAEADVMSAYALVQGVPPGQVVAEDRSRSTTQNLLFTRDLLEERGMAEARVLIMTSAFHVARTGMLASRLGLRWQVTGAPSYWYQLVGNCSRELLAFVVERWAGVSLTVAGAVAYAVILVTLS